VQGQSDPIRSSCLAAPGICCSGNAIPRCLEGIPRSAVVTGVLSKVTANNNFNGILAEGSFTSGTTLNVTIVDSEASNNNSNAGVFAISSNVSAPAAVMARNVVASYNGTGLDVGLNAILRVAHSVDPGNGVGVFINLGIINSCDHDIDGNTANKTGVLTPLAMH